MAKEKSVSTEVLMTSPFRLSFPEVFEPKAMEEGQKKKYSITMLYKPQDPGLMELRKLLHKAAVLKWGADVSKWPGNLRGIDMKTYLSPNGKDGWPIRDGNRVDYEGYKDHVFLKASSPEGNRKPRIVDKDRNDIFDKQDVFGGLLCRAYVNAYAYVHPTGGPGVSLGLAALQVLKDDGLRWSGGATADIQAWEDDAGSDNPANYTAAAGGWED